MIQHILKKTGPRIVSSSVPKHRCLSEQSMIQGLPNKLIINISTKCRAVKNMESMYMQHTRNPLDGTAIR
ncbi:MAG: hypothetical protein ACRC10_07435 [Thermoguttaceae bacterium]